MPIKSIETFCTQAVGFVRVTAHDGAIGWGQVSTCHSDIASTVLHRQVAPHALGNSTRDIDALVERIPELSEDENQAIIEQYTLMTQLAFKQDIDIWHNKTRVDNPLLCDEDGPLQLLRPWYDQFYVDVDDVPEAQTKLHEWEWGSDGN